MSFFRPNSPDDAQKQVEALHLKLRAFVYYNIQNLQPVQKRESVVTANVILSLIDRMKEDASQLPRRYILCEAFAYNALGLIALDEGTPVDSVNRALTHFKRDLEVSEAIGNHIGIADAISNVAHANAMHEGGNGEELLKASQNVYELFLTKCGEENERTLRAGCNYAINLQKANRGAEARELFTKLLTTSKQVLVTHHNITKRIEFYSG